MFGSNFFGQFGIPDFGYQNADPQGGLFGPNAPGQPPMSQNDAGGATPIAGQPSPAGPAALGQSSPLSSAAMLPGSGAAPAQSAEQQAPAAGIASQFGSQPHG